MPTTPVDLRTTLAARLDRARDAHAARRDRAVAAVERAGGALARRGALSAAWIVGSAVWGAFGERSDVDVVVEGLAPSALVDVADSLAHAAGTMVDLLRIEDLPERFQDRVRRDGARIA